VIDVGVGEEKKVDIYRRYRPVLHGRDPIPALGQAAIHQDVKAVDPQQVAGSGDPFFAAQVGDGVSGFDWGLLFDGC
jgi:hypothetical protein